MFRNKHKSNLMQESERLSVCPKEEVQKLGAPFLRDYGMNYSKESVLKVMNLRGLLRPHKMASKIALLAMILAWNVTWPYSFLFSRSRVFRVDRRGKNIDFLPSDVIKYD